MKFFLFNSGISFFLILITMLLFILNIFISSFIFIGLCLFTTILTFLHYLIISLLSRNLPGTSKYNPLGYIELHVNGKSNRNKRLFIEFSAATVLEGVKLRRNVIFYFWHLKEESLRKVFKDALVICKPLFHEKLIGLLNSFIFKSNQKHPPLKCLIIVNKLTPESIKYIESRNNKVGGVTKRGKPKPVY